jgi:hypothetical protein
MAVMAAGNEHQELRRRALLERQRQPGRESQVRARYERRPRQAPADRETNTLDGACH